MKNEKKWGNNVENVKNCEKKKELINIIKRKKCKMREKCEKKMTKND